MTKNGEAVLCRRFGEPPLGWEYVKQSKDGYPIYAIEKNPGERSFDRREWENLKQRRLTEEQNRHANSLSAEERDREIRKLLPQLTLNSEHKADLIRRGLNEEQIKSGMFRSIKRFQKLDKVVSHRLAGVNFSGTALTNRQAGYICPIWSIDKLIIGWQVRVDEPLDGGKYKWPTSKSKKRPNGATAHLPNGELPLTVCRPQGRPLGIAWIEGILKPYIAAQLSGYIVIGGSGGHFPKQQLQKILKSLTKEVGIDCIDSFPDANAVGNGAVFQRDTRTINFIQSLGYTVRVGDWGQLWDKSQPDFDELLASSGSCNRFITADEYINLSELPRTEKRDREISKAEWMAVNAWRSFQDLFNQIKEKVKFKPEEPPTSAIIKTEKSESAIIDIPGARACYILSPIALKPYRIDYVPGQLPTLEEWIALGKPAVEFKNGQRNQIIIEAYQKGYGDLHDNTPPGFFKSSQTGAFTRSDFGLADFDEEKSEDNGGRIFYLSADHKNPTTKSVEENTEDLINRHEGEDLDPNRLTPLGNPYRTRTKKGKSPDIPANCPETQTFLLAHEEKDTYIHGGKGSVICDRCHLFNSCGFLAQRREQLKRKNNLRAHISQIGSAASSKDIAIVDEPGTLLEASKSTPVSREDIYHLFSKLRLNDRELYDRLSPFLGIIQDILENAISEGIPKHGFSHLETLALFYTCWEGGEGEELDRDYRIPAHARDAVWDEKDFPEWERREESHKDFRPVQEVWEKYQKHKETYEHPLTAKFWKMFEREDPWTISTIEEIKQRVQKAVKNNWEFIFQGSQTPEARQAAIREKATFNFLNHFIDVISGTNKKVNIRIIEDGKYLITRPSKQHQFTLSRFKFRAYLDSTINLIDLQRKTGQEYILQIQQKVNSNAFDNFTVKVVKGLGTNPKGTQATTTIKRYLAAVQGAIRQTGLDKEKAALLTFKSNLETFKDLGIQTGYWHRDSRGNNRFTNINLLALHGLPKPNLGEMATQWQAMTGRSVNPAEKDPLKRSHLFWWWYEQQVMGELIQALGRPRAHLRPEEKIEVVLLAGDALSDHDVTTLQKEFPGCKIELVEAYDLAPEAAAKGVRQQQRAIKVAWEMLKDGVQPKLEAIAKQLDVTKGRASQIFKTLHDGGFRSIQRSLVFLLDAFNGKTKLSELDEDTQYFARTYLPLLAKGLENPNHTEDIVASVLAVTENFPAKQVRRILAATPRWALGKLFGAFMQVALNLLIDKSPPVAIAQEASG